MNKARQARKARQRAARPMEQEAPQEAFYCFNCGAFVLWADPNKLETPADAIMCDRCTTLPEPRVISEHQEEHIQREHAILELLASGVRAPNVGERCPSCAATVRNATRLWSLAPGALWCTCICWGCRQPLMRSPDGRLQCDHGASRI